MVKQFSDEPHKQEDEASPGGLTLIRNKGVEVGRHSCYTCDDKFIC